MPGYNCTPGVVNDEATGLRALIDGTDAVDGHLDATGRCITRIGVLSSTGEAPQSKQNSFYVINFMKKGAAHAGARSSESVRR